MVKEKIKNMCSKLFNMYDNIIEYTREQVEKKGTVLSFYDKEICVTMLDISSEYCYNPTFDKVSIITVGDKHKYLRFHCIDGDSLFKDYSWVNENEIEWTYLLDMVQWIDWDKVN